MYEQKNSVTENPMQLQGSAEPIESKRHSYAVRRTTSIVLLSIN